MIIDNSSVLLVDDTDRPIKLMDKMEAHVKGELRRAFSIFIFNSKNQFLLQKRAESKYHAGGLWTNTCCSHPLTENELVEEAKFRLNEEMGMEIAELKKGFSFTYKTEFNNGLIENEFDHVLYGFTDDLPKLNPDEAQDFRYLYFEDLHAEVEANPKAFTPWFLLCYQRIFNIAVLENNDLI